MHSRAVQRKSRPPQAPRPACAFRRRPAPVRRRPANSGPARTISTSTRSPICASVIRWTDCSQGDLPSIWPGSLPLRSISTSQRPPDGRRVERRLVAVERGLQALEAVVHHLGGAIWPSMSAAGVPGRGRVFEAERRGVADRVDQAQRVGELGVGLAGEADDEVARQRDVGPRGADAVEDARDRSRGCGCGSSP